MTRLLILLSLVAPLSACTQFPELDAATSPEARRAGYPRLVPIETILARRDTPSTALEATDYVDARAARLRARARLLRGISIDEDTRLRLAPQLKRLGG